jgi:uncharacterized membrane protein
MTILALALHILGAIIWVGGMFAIYMCLRQALGTLEPPQRLRLMRVTFQKFFPLVWASILLLLASGYWMVFMTFGGMARRDASDWPKAGEELDRIRQIISVNLPLGLIVAIVGATGRYWG